MHRSSCLELVHVDALTEGMRQQVEREGYVPSNGGGSRALDRVRVCKGLSLILFIRL